MQILSQADQWPRRCAMPSGGGIPDWEQAGAYDEEYLQRNPGRDYPQFPQRERKWYHASTNELPIGTVLRPQHQSPHLDYYEDNYQGATPTRRNWVWVEPDLEGTKQWASRKVPYVYEVQPDNYPLPWNGSGQYGHVTNTATVTKFLGTYPDVLYPRSF